ncbi:hypothetical protein BX600DRAFT_308001 [Xylariales sp. PMI_506]|nr:hypothetical protein BX600DRAFT_308001 [Xylariales sp. PMI_506]
MADPRYRYSGRRSPTFHPGRASMPLSVGYSSLYGGDIHTIPTSPYHATRRQAEQSRGPVATITTYNVTKDPITRSASVRDTSRTRHRSSTMDSGPVKPIIVTTNHSRPHNSSSHNTSGRSGSPSRDPYRSSEETYYAQPASSIRSRSHTRHGGVTSDNEEFYRLRERVGGDDRLRAPGRPHSRQSMYVGTSRPSTSAIDFGLEDYEYTKPSDLARYDLDHDRPRSRTGRRDSIERGHYYRPSVSVVSSDVSARSDGRRGPPPTASGLDRYNRNAAAGIYDRPSVAMPALPAVPPPPPVDTTRRSGLLDAPPSPSVERRGSRSGRPVSLYQDFPRMSQADEMYRPRDEERVHRERRDRERGDEAFRDDAIASRGFGIRPELLEHQEHRRPVEIERRDHEDRPRREHDEREPKRRSDDDLDKSRGRGERRPSEVKERPVRVEESKERRDSKDSGRGEKIREKVTQGLGAAAAAIGLGAVARDGDKGEDKDPKVSPRRRRDSEVDGDPLGSRATERYKLKESEAERKSSPRGEPIIVEQRGDLKKDRVNSTDDTGSRERERDKELNKDRDREKDRNRREAEAKLVGAKDDTRENSPYSDDSASGNTRRRHRASSAFNPTDTKGLMDLKAQLAAMEVTEKSKEKERPAARDRSSDPDVAVSSGSSISEKQPVSRTSRDRPRDESRGRDLAIVEPEQKQVRVVSPPRDKSDQKPIKGILKQPTSQFPEEPNPIREGVAPHKDDKTKKDVPQGARWTKINRRLVNPEALTIGKERFEVRDDFVIVLRVLSKEEIQAYATATAQLRETEARG